MTRFYSSISLVAFGLVDLGWAKLPTTADISASSPNHASSLPECSVKLSFEAFDVQNKEVDWTSVVEELGIRAQQSRQGDHLAKCADLGSSVSCRYSNHKANTDVDVSLTSLFDATYDSISIDVRLSSGVEDICGNLQENLIDLALDSIPRALAISPKTSIWSIKSSKDSLLDEASLYRRVLGNNDVVEKMRTKKKGDISIWTYRTAGSDSDTTDVFVKGTLRYEANSTASVAHAETLVHPVMISHPDPKRVLLISDMPFGPLKEITKYVNLDTVDVVGTSVDMQDLIRNDLNMDDVLGEQLRKVTFIQAESVYEWAEMEVQQRGCSLESNEDEEYAECTERDDEYPEETPEAMLKRHEWLRTLCENDEFARFTKARGFDWERELYCKDKYYPIVGVDEQDVSGNATGSAEGKESKCAYDLIFIDATIYNQEELTFLLLHRHLKAMMKGANDSLMVMSLGAAPKLLLNGNEGEEQNTTRDIFVRQLTRPTEKGGLAYQFATVYDESLAAPLSSAFVLAFMREDLTAYDRFFRTNSATYDLDMIERLVPITGSGRTPTVLYDGPTHMKYQAPSRNWEHWYCRTAPGKDLPGCTVFTNWIFDPARHHNNVERRVHPIKGRSLHAMEYIPKDHFVNFDDIVHSLSLDQTEWDSLVKFVEKYPDAELYRQLRDFIVIYGFESRSLGMTGWAVSSSSTNTFTNHACTNEDITVATVDYFVSLSEDGHFLKFSPLSTRRPRMASYATTAKRDIQPGEELQMNYQIFRSDFEEHPYFDTFLTGMCSTGVGMVPVPDTSS